MSVDLRTRWDDAVPVVDGATFLSEALPALIAAAPEPVRSTGVLDLRPVVVEVDGEAVTLSRSDDGRPVVTPGASGTAQERWVLSAAQLADLVNDQVTPVGLMTAGDLRLDRGRIARIMDWWLVLRAVLDDRCVLQPGSLVPEPDVDAGFTLGGRPRRAGGLPRAQRLPPPSGGLLPRGDGTSRR